MKKVVLIILDGFGASPLVEGNAILSSKTNFLDYCWANYPKTLLKSSGEEVGLDFGEMGNSEVGHINIGTGRIPTQDLTRINKTIEDGSFYKTQYLIEACAHAKKYNSTLHLLGLISEGGIHSHVNHIIALIDLAKRQNVKKLAIHCILDGRDMAAKSADKVLEKIQHKINQSNLGKIATLIGRFYAMDRDKNWDRIKKAYDLIVCGKGEKYNSVNDALEDRYRKKEDDEKISPIILDDNYLIKSNDSLIFFNFRADRAKQLSEALANPDFNLFDRKKYPRNLRFITFVSYGNEQTPLINVAYMEDKISGQIAQKISDANLTQLHIAETEKYAHVTYFFNGGVDNSFRGEDRIIVPSLKVNSYDLRPEMSAELVKNKFIKYFKEKRPDFSVINFANPDMVGHTGNFSATKKAVSVVDGACMEIFKNVINDDVVLMITSDHGNADQMINMQTQEIDKQHTTNPVPFVIIEKDANKFVTDMNIQISKDEKINFFSQEPTGVLADISPTILNYLDVQQDNKMTGINLKDVI
jgi:2,3-bisphosphoglycerate-independent phosphoglycerate mutase